MKIDYKAVFLRVSLKQNADIHNDLYLQIKIENNVSRFIKIRLYLG